MILLGERHFTLELFLIEEDDGRWKVGTRITEVTGGKQGAIVGGVRTVRPDLPPRAATVEAAAEAFDLLLQEYPDELGQAIPVEVAEGAEEAGRVVGN